MVCEGMTQRGTDCSFDERVFSTVTAALWILTALPLLAWAMPCLRRAWSASGPARASLLLAAASALCCFVDDLLKFQESYGNQMLWSIGSIFLVFAVCSFSVAWCDVAAALGSLHARRSGHRLLAGVRLTYKWMAVLNMPVGLLFSLHDYKFMIDSGYGWVVTQVWGAWMLFGTIFVLSGLACAQCYIARFHLASVDGARSLRRTALVNLMQQVLFDVCIAVYAALYLADNKLNSSNIAAYHAVGFVTFWAMHVQVVVFFAILGSTDPLYSQEGLHALLVKATDESADEVPPTTVGTPAEQPPKAIDAE